MSSEESKKGFSKKDLISNAVKKELSDSVKDKKDDRNQKNNQNRKDTLAGGNLLSEASALDVHDRVQKRRGIFASILFLVFLFFAAGYFLFMNPWWKKPSSNILLSGNPITSGSIEILREKEKFIFKVGSPVYIYFQWENPLKRNELTISVDMITARSTSGNQNAKEQIAVNHFEINNPAIDRIYTLFQKDFFTETGDYEMIIKSAGEILDKRSFSIVH